ncbi:MAG: GC-type dockerin domain-anchored protein [Phycisphaerales bacterium JB059]
MHRSLTAIAALVCASPALAQLVDPGFETTTPTQQIPDTFGVWGFDRASTTGPTQGITPLEGERMLRFEGTAPLCAPDGGASGAVGQLVALPRGEVDPSTCVTLTARFNRVAGEGVDTQFRVVIAALDGDPSTYPTGCGTVRPALLSTSASIFSDDDPQTWETATTTMVLPEGATFLALIVSAQENVIDDDTPPFAGHFADDVRLDFNTGPCSIADVAEPFCLLDFTDAITFLSAFGDEDPLADFAAPFGVYDFTDILAFLTAFNQGCVDK